MERIDLLLIINEFRHVFRFGESLTGFDFLPSVIFCLPRIRKISAILAVRGHFLNSIVLVILTLIRLEVVLIELEF